MFCDVVHNADVRRCFHRWGPPSGCDEQREHEKEWYEALCRWLGGDVRSDACEERAVWGLGAVRMLG
jgi:hypothetical protein